MDTKTGANIGIVAVELSGKTVADVPVTVSLFRRQWVA